MEETIKDMWATRPRRARKGRKVAGVAAGIGQRYGIDPLIPRVVLAVMTFYGGAGILFYLLGWLLLPEEGDETSPAESLAGKGRSSSSTVFTVVLCLALIPVSGWVFDRDLGGFLGVAAGLGLLFALHRRRSHLGRVSDGPVADEAPTSTMATPGAATPDAGAPPIDEHGFRTAPPTWDPLGAAPFAWDLPEPSDPAPDEPRPPRKPRSKAGVITVGVAMVVVGAAVLAEPHLGGWVSAPHVIGVVLGVLGLGMVAGSFTRGGRGLIGLAAPLAALGVAMTVVWPEGFSPSGVGDIDARPTTLDQVQRSYQLDVGSARVDLTALPASGSTTTRVEVGMGDVEVVVPGNADVTVHCAVGLGNAECLGETRGGPGGAEFDRTDHGPDGPGGVKIDLTAEITGPGSVVVERG